MLLYFNKKISLLNLKTHGVEDIKLMGRDVALCMEKAGLSYEGSAGIKSFSHFDHKRHLLTVQRKQNKMPFKNIKGYSQIFPQFYSNSINAPLNNEFIINIKTYIRRTFIEENFVMFL